MAEYSVTIHGAFGSMAEAMTAELGWACATKQQADDLCDAVNLVLETTGVGMGGERFAMVTELGVPSASQLGVGSMDQAGKPVGVLQPVALSVLHDIRERYEGDLADLENTSLDNLPALPTPVPPGTPIPKTLEEMEAFLDG